MSVCCISSPNSNDGFNIHISHNQVTENPCSIRFHARPPWHRKKLKVPPGGYSHIGTVRACATGKLPFLALAAPKVSTFSTCAARKDPPFQNYICFFVIFSSKTPFSRVGHFWEPPIFSKRPLPKPPILNTPWHIYSNPKVTLQFLLLNIFIPVSIS